MLDLLDSLYYNVFSAGRQAEDKQAHMGGLQFVPEPLPAIGQV